MLCSLSNAVPSEPVVGNGYLYERSVIEKHLDAEGTCPHTGDALAKADLVAIKAGKVSTARPVTATSVPGLLGMLQDEYDGLMLECFTLRKHLNRVRQELSSALYQHDAACRVIARLTKERDTARAQLQSALSTAASDDVEMEGKEEGIPQRVLLRMSTLAATLSASRKNRPMPEGLASKAQVKAFAKKSSHKIHSSSSGGVLCLAAHATEAQALTGGVDKTARLFDTKAGKVKVVFKGHGGRVSAAAFVGDDRFVTASHDKTIRVWNADGKGVAKLTTHRAEVSDVALHPSGSYIVSTSLDKSWAFSDLDKATTYYSSADAADAASAATASLECCAFHPDGALFAAGGDAQVINVFDVNTCANVASFAGHEGVVNAVAFSSNGYLMASASDDGTARVFDLRKLKQLHSLSLDAAAKSVAWDRSGKYLAAGTAKGSVSVFAGKAGALLFSHSDHSKAVMGVAFDANTHGLLSASLDKQLTIFTC